jgi:flagellar hook assembly protein FlgD
MIASTALIDASGTPGISTQRAKLSREEFLKILVTELTHQNPLDPLDNSEFLQQLVNLQNLETMAMIADGMRAFGIFLKLTSASSLIGRSIRALSDSGEIIQGVVSRVILDGKDVKLVVGEEIISFGSLKEIF